MTADAASQDRALRALAACAVEATGFAPESILPDALRRVLDRELRAGRSADDVESIAAGRAPDLVRALQQAVTVGETFFFRHPQQFEWVASQVAPAFDAPRPFRAWSAGCATGEEAYSIAACLRGSLPAGATLSVLATDLVERNLGAARVARYGRWSVRDAAPMLWPLLEGGTGEAVTIRDDVRALVTFREHNLLDAPPEGDGAFDLVFCRNVLVYFSPGAVRMAVSNLARALAPGGVLVFGPMDVSEPPPGTVRLGAPELQLFRRASKSDRAPAPAPVSTPPPVRAAPPRPSAPPPARPPPPAPKAAPPPPGPVARGAPAMAAAEPVALHLRALAHIDRGEDGRAATLLDDLCRGAPGYVPGLLERALLHERHQQASAAFELMSRVWLLVEELPPDELLPAPEPLPAGFYASSAAAFLARHARR